MVELQPSKLAMRVRSPSPALTLFLESATLSITFEDAWVSTNDLM